MPESTIPSDVVESVKLDYGRTPAASTHPMKSRSPSLFAGFTLIELLAVITIVGVLAGITIPLVSRTRDSARATQCRANLRQSYVAILLYSQDNRGRLPGPLLGAQSSLYSNQTNHQSMLASRLAPYQSLTLDSTVRRNPHLLCPAHAAKMNNPAADERSYGVLLDSSTKYPFGNANDGANPWLLSEYTSTYNPKTLWMLRDVDRTIVPGNTYLTAEQVHRGGHNFLFFDGSVRLLDAGEQVRLAGKISTNRGW